MIVVDTNLIVYLFLNSPHSLQAEQALEEAFERWEYLESLKNGA